MALALAVAVPRAEADPGVRGKSSLWEAPWLQEWPLLKQFRSHPKVLKSRPFTPPSYFDLPLSTQKGRFFDAYQDCVTDFSLARSQQVVVEKFQYRSGEERVTAFAMMPKFPGSHQLPVLIYNRGGNQEFGRVTICEIDFLSEYFASQGYLVLATQYRGVDGGTGADEYGGADVEDVLSLVELARSLPFADLRNIHLAGYSRGGMMTYLALKRGVPVKSAVVIAGPSDLRNQLRYRPEMEQVFRHLIPGYDHEPWQTLGHRSAAHWPNEIQVPLLLIHGTADVAVSAEDSVVMARQLQQLGKAHKLLLFAGEGHGLWSVRPEMARAMQRWFDE